MTWFSGFRKSPSSLRKVTKIGSSLGTITGEEVWNNSPTSQQAGGGSTGSRLPRPDYQKNLSISGGRIVPDISFIASPSAYGQIPLFTPWRNRKVKANFSKT
ncbi:MAG: hypothetical protein EXQ68_06985 [Acidimicrobiia bacterium]|nr:hypothetical protein [Acidimicrobiia bacterium]